eukprot:TRINITY_DN8424_c5_g1_i1.p1 TRINITY_DN8424_c5_g1~~TRINITY_DN8424_c5_g1_i1.p1  ORF type:complete len:300 (+),score=51.29 TRINITY_DN8424_c5_g1_i1:425-1324(+)
MKAVKRIIGSSTKEALFRELSAIRAKGELTTEQVVAGINQCAVLRESEEPGNALVDNVLDMVSPDAYNDHIYSSMTRTYQRTGYPAEAITAFKCLSQPSGGDIASGMVAAAAVGDSKFADALWRSAHAGNLLDTADEEHRDALIKLSANYVAAKVRSKNLSHTKHLLAHLSDKLKIELDADSWELLLASCTSKVMLDLIWEHTPSSCRTASAFSTTAWTYLSVGCPDHSIALCAQAQEAGISSLSHYCCAAEAQLTLLNMKGSVDIKKLKSNIEKAAEHDASEQWLQTVRTVANKVTSV